MSGPRSYTPLVPLWDRTGNKIKEWRGLATRHDKTPVSYLAGLYLWSGAAFGRPPLDRATAPRAVAFQDGASVVVAVDSLGSSVGGRPDGEHDSALLGRGRMCVFF